MKKKVHNSHFVLLAQEGFLPERYKTMLRKENIRVLHIHWLSDGIAFHAVPAQTLQRIR